MTMFDHGINVKTAYEIINSYKVFQIGLLITDVNCYITRRSIYRKVLHKEPKQANH